MSILHHCKVPCNDCPFRKNSLAGWLGEYTPRELHDTVMSEVLYPCHQTCNELGEHSLDPMELHAGTKKHPLCAGALLYMKKACKRPMNGDLNDAVQKFANPELQETILSVPEFFEHHKQS